jgi:hypothetical protein
MPAPGAGMTFSRHKHALAARRRQAYLIPAGLGAGEDRP